MKHAVGERVLVVRNIGNHGFKMPDVLEILSKNRQDYNTKSLTDPSEDTWYVDDEELEPIPQVGEVAYLCQHSDEQPAQGSFWSSNGTTYTVAPSGTMDTIRGLGGSKFTACKGVIRSQEKGAVYLEGYLGADDDSNTIWVDLTCLRFRDEKYDYGHDKADPVAEEVPEEEPESIEWLDNFMSNTYPKVL